MPIQSGQPSIVELPQHPTMHPISTSETRELDNKAWLRYVRGQQPCQVGNALSQSVDWAEATIRRLLELRETGYQPMVRAHVEKLLDDVNMIRRAAWSGWRRSRQNKVRTVEKTKEAGPQSRGGNETVVTTEPQCGNASFLRMLTECNKRESGLRGIEKPTAIRSDPTQKHADLATLIQQMEAAMTMEIQRQYPAHESLETDSVEPGHHSSQEAQD